VKYLLNTAILPLTPPGPYLVRARQISLEEARTLLQGGFLSAVGHKATAELLTSVLGVPVPENRIAVSLREGDMAIAFLLSKRLPEGMVIHSPEELNQIGYTFWLYEVLPPSP